MGVIAVAELVGAAPAAILLVVVAMAIARVATNGISTHTVDGSQLGLYQTMVNQ